VPRDVVAQPKAFGQAPGLLEPAPDVDVSGERYRAAMIQHIMAVTVRAGLLKSHGITPPSFAERFPDRGLGADRVRRIFRGETMAQLTDLMFWMEQVPDVAAAICEQTSAWFGVIATEPEASVVVEAPAPPPEPSVQETLAALRMSEAAQRSGVGAPAMRRSPANPYVSAPRGIRHPPR
jgi:hypothetical protein